MCGGESTLKSKKEFCPGQRAYWLGGIGGVGSGESDEILIRMSFPNILSKMATVTE